MVTTSFPTMDTYIRFLTLGAAITLCTSYPYFQESIPNGKNVPHPCVDGYIWEGVGHENTKGASTRNVFGVDFKKNKFVWDSVICNQDSDGDGKSNGAELGDPDCTWTPGTSPKYTTGLSHPGICEPLDSAQCGGRPSFVDCDESDEFECDAIKEPDTFNYTVRFPDTAVPAKETTYICITFAFPMDQEYHLVADVPHISNQDVMHHTLVYGCEGAETAPGPLMEPTECGGEMNGCRELIAGWAAGSRGECMDKNMGFLIGANKGLKYAVMQHHWNNPQEIADYRDSSGMTFHLTPKLRPYNAGVLMIGQTSLDIPPGQTYYSASGACPSECMTQFLDGDIYISAVVNHMHLLGAAQYTELWRDDSYLMHLANDRVYDYNTPVTHRHADPVLLRKGDQLKTTCIFNAKSMTRTTNFGDATSDEMCLSFFTYYPKENLRTGRCVQWNSLSECEMRYQDVTRGCNIKQMYNYSNPVTMKIFLEVQDLCVPGKCLQECLDHVRELKKQPCFTGDVGKLVRRSLTSWGKDVDSSIAWYARLDSCDIQLLQERMESINAGVLSQPLHILAVLLITFLPMFA